MNELIQVSGSRDPEDTTDERAELRLHEMVC